MFDTALMLPGSRSSVLEAALRRWLEQHVRPAFVVDGPPHVAPRDRLVGLQDGRPGGAEPALTGFAQVLEDGAERLSAANELRRQQARLAAAQARELAAFARLRPAALLDRPDGEVGAAAAATRAARPRALTHVSEWAVDEVMARLRLSSGAAARLLAASIALVEQLPASLAALEAGRISWDHALALVDWLSPLDAGVRTTVEERLLGRADRWNVAQLRDAARRAVLRADAEGAARRAAAAIRERRVAVYPGKDGMATLSAVLPTAVAVACRSALKAYAGAAAAPGDDRTLDQRMVDCLSDILLRQQDGRPPVQITLTVVAGVDTLAGGDEPGEIDGHPVPALMVRELAYALGLLPRPSGSDARAECDVAGAAAVGGAGESPADAVPESEGPAGNRMPTDGRATAGLAALLGARSIAGTGLARIPEIAVVDEISGQLLALTDAAELRRIATCGRRKCRSGRRACVHPMRDAGPGPPPPTEGYSPNAPLERFVRLRDRRCRFPGCRTGAARCDLDHNVPYPVGETSCDNLCCLCRHHHRLSHQAPGWSMRRLADGGLEWTTPGGERLVTRPPAFGADGDPSPLGSPRPSTRNPSGSRARSDPLIDPLLGRPPRPGDEPAPF